MTGKGKGKKRKGTFFKVSSLLALDHQLGTLYTEINKLKQIKSNVDFGGEGKTSQSGVENQQTQPTYDTESGIQPGPHWLEASTLTTTPALHSKAALSSQLL